MAPKKTEHQSILRQPSWWVVVISGTLFVVFLVAIVREVVSWHSVRQQVSRLQSQVATAQTQQRQLQDLIDYLGSPTFQEREARLQLGLKKSGERVIVLPSDANTNTDNQNDSLNQATGTGGTASSGSQRWWKYFFGPRPAASS